VRVWVTFTGVVPPFPARDDSTAGLDQRVTVARRVARRIEDRLEVLWDASSVPGASYSLMWRVDERYDAEALAAKLAASSKR
jgi:hypothetical protein